jgi:hypothetical protein
LAIEAGSVLRAGHHAGSALGVTRCANLTIAQRALNASGVELTMRAAVRASWVSLPGQGR